MRKARIIEEMSAYYHVVSRVVGREFVFGETDECEKFRKTLRAAEGYRHVLLVRAAGRKWHIEPSPVPY